MTHYSYSEAAAQRCSWEKVFCKYTANLQCDFNNFAEHLFLRTPLGGCFWYSKEIQFDQEM